MLFPTTSVVGNDRVLFIWPSSVQNDSFYFWWIVKLELRFTEMFLIVNHTRYIQIWWIVYVNKTLTKMSLLTIHIRFLGNRNFDELYLHEKYLRIVI